jgi:hypothetical protein
MIKRVGSTLLLAALVLGCDPKGMCVEEVEEKAEAAHVAVSVCFVNAHRSALCAREHGTFTSLSPEAALAACEAQGFTKPHKMNGIYTSRAQVIDDAKAGKLIPFFKR